MEERRHSLTNLFAQLGLPSAPEDIRRFIEANRPLAADLSLHQAPCWSPSQSEFLLENILNDADWSEVIDGLNIALRRSKS